MLNNVNTEKDNPDQIGIKYLDTYRIWEIDYNPSRKKFKFTLVSYKAAPILVELDLLSPFGTTIMPYFDIRCMLRGKKLTENLKVNLEAEMYKIALVIRRKIGDLNNEKLDICRIL